VVLRAVKPDSYIEVKAVKIERLALAQITELRDIAHRSPADARVW
jgi:hypothetical protein